MQGGEGSGNVNVLLGMSLFPASPRSVCHCSGKDREELCRAFLLEAGPCLFARMKAASGRRVDLSRKGKGSKRTHSFPRSIKFCEIVSMFQQGKLDMVERTGQREGKCEFMLWTKLSPLKVSC